MNKKLPIILILSFSLLFTIPPTQSAEGDYLGTHWDSNTTSPRGICTDDTNIWILSKDDDTVRKFSMTGTYIGSWNLHADNDNPDGGITTDGTNIWVTDYADPDEVFKYNMAGTFVSSFSAAGLTLPSGICTNGSNIWITDGINANVLKYQMDGTYVATYDLAAKITQGRGICTDDTYFWLIDQVNDTIVKYDMSFNYQSSWDLDALNGDSYGIEVSDCNFYATDTTDNEVYVYNNDVTAPTPNPTTWSVEPTAPSTDTITMTASTASDDCCAVQYYFDETSGNPGATDSGWQASPTYSDTGLTFNTEYTYKVWTKDCRDNHAANSSSKSATTKKHIYTYSTYSIQHDSVTLDAYCYDTTGDLGFYFGNESVSQSSFDQNVTVYYNREDYTGPFIKVVATNQSTYYHARAWYSGDDGSFHMGDEVQFITPPQYPPSNLTVYQIGYDWMNLTWDNEFFEYTSANQSTVIKYQLSAYPTWSNGYELYNGTGTYVNTTGIVSIGFSTTLYFSGWTYTNDTASPLLWTYSASPAHALGLTLSGLFNMTIRWENSTYGKISLDDPSRDKHKHKFFIYYPDGYEENYYEEGLGWYITDTPNFDDPDETDGNWTIKITRSPREMTFEWEGYDSSWFFWDSGDHCSRTLVMDQFPDKNITFYLRTDLNFVPLLLGGVVDWMNQSFLGQYEYEFIDNHGDFSYNDNPYAYIYTYDKDGEMIIIHSEYLDRNMEINPMLVFGKTYYLGIKSDKSEITYLGKASTGTDGHVVIIIPRDIIYDYSIFDYIDVTVGTSSTQAYIDFTDSTFTTVEATIEIVHYLNGTQVYTESTNLDAYNFTFTTLNGFSTDYNYAWRLNVTFQTLGTFTTGYIPLYSTQDYTITSAEDVNTLLTLMFGPTPVVTSDGVGVSYAYLCVLVFAVIGLLTFKPEAAHIGLFVEGLIFMLSAGVMSGLNSIFSDYSWQQGVALGAVGFFLLILGIWASLGGKKKEEKE